MSRLLITGFPGWLTSRFLDTLSDYSHDYDFIRCLILPGTASRTEMHPAADEYVEGDLTDPSGLENATRGMDVVLHSAGVLHVRRIADFYRVNSEGTRHLLQACASQKVKKFIYISSNAAQGFCKGPGHELIEEDPCRPESPYGRSKYHGELAVQEYQSSGKLETVILRSAMFYGPPVAPRHLNIYHRIQTGWFPVFGSGDCLRSITFIDNLVQGVHLALSKEQANGKVYYITDREIPTLKDIVMTLADAMSIKVKLLHFPVALARGAGLMDEIISAAGFYWMLPHLVGESAKHIACRITKAEQELGYDPRISFRDGYPLTIRWCQDQGLL